MPWIMSAEEEEEEEQIKFLVFKADVQITPLSDLINSHLVL